MELAAQAPALDSLLVPVGGGGLIGGIAAWYSGGSEGHRRRTGGSADPDRGAQGWPARRREDRRHCRGFARDAAVGRPPFSRGLEHTRAKITRGM